MQDKEVFLTFEGKERLEEELEFLRTVRRPQVAQRIYEAKAEGDISENAGYDEAKTEQAFVEGRILTLEAMLRNAVIIEASGSTETVRLGHRVTVVEDGGRPETYQIVGPAEVDPSSGRISNESPLGNSLLGHGVGDTVTVQTPDGTLRFQITRID